MITFEVRIIIERGARIDVISAALVIADKTDVRRSRVRQKEKSAFDIHDRANYAVTDSKLKIDEEKSVIALNLQIDENICSMYDYFEIFLGRMMFCRKSAEILFFVKYWALNNKFLPGQDSPQTSRRNHPKNRNHRCHNRSGHHRNCCHHEKSRIRHRSDK